MKDLSTKEGRRAHRPPIFQENPELGVIAAKAGFFTIRALAKAVNRNEGVVGLVLRREKRAPLAEKAIADALNISVNKLRTVTEPKTSQTANPPALAAAA